MDQYAIECMSCGLRKKYVYSTPEAIQRWNDFVDKFKEDENANAHNDR